MYQLTQNDSVIRVDDGAVIPADPENSDYQAFLKWRDGWVEDVLDGDGAVLESINHAPNVPLPVTLEKVIVISMVQARRALSKSGMLAAIDSAVGGLSEEERIVWEFSTSVHANDALVLKVTKGMGISEKQLDDLFTLASGL